MSQIGFEAPDHHGVEVARLHRNPARKPLRVKDFEQRGKRVGVAVVRRGRKKETMLEPLGKPAHRARELAVDRVA